MKYALDSEPMLQRVYSACGEHAGEIARQWHPSAAILGAERGVPRCVAAADAAEKTAPRAT